MSHCSYYASVSDSTGVTCILLLMLNNSNTRQLAWPLALLQCCMISPHLVSIAKHVQKSDHRQDHAQRPHTGYAQICFKNPRKECGC
jgi:hypothetical protein